MEIRIAVPVVVIAALSSLGLYGGVFAQADVNADGAVNILDLSVIGSCLGQDPETVPLCENADADGNGIIELNDLYFVSELFDFVAEAGGNPPDQRAFLWHDREVSSSSLPADAANPFRGHKTPLTYTATGAGNRRYYTRSSDLATLTDPRLQELFWQGDDPSDGYTDLVDPFPPELDEFFDTDVYFAAPKDSRIPANQPASNPNQKFGGDYSGEAPCLNETLVGHQEDWLYPFGSHFNIPGNPPRCDPNPPYNCPGVPGSPVVHDPSIPHGPTPPPGSPDQRTLLMRQLDGTDKNAGCEPFTNVRISGGAGEQPMRPAPDRSNRFTPIDPGVPQGLAFPPPSAAVYERRVDIATGRPLIANGSGLAADSCSGEANAGSVLGGQNAPAERNPKSYRSTSPAGIGRNPACLKPGGAPGGLNQNGFTVARDDGGEPRFARTDATGAPFPGPGSTFVSDGVNTFPLSVVPIECATPDEFGDCEPMRYEVGLNESSVNGLLFADGHSPENALEHHSADQGAFACICDSAPPFLRGRGGCALSAFGSPRLIDDLVAPIPIVEAMTCLLAGEIGDACSTMLDAISVNLQGVPPLREASRVPLNRDRSDGTITAQAPDPNNKGIVNRDTLLRLGPGASIAELILYSTKFLPGPEDMLTLDSTLTNEQRALLGCGPFYGTRCDTSLVSPGLFFGINYCNLLGTGCSEGGGIDLLNMEFSAVAQSTATGSGATDPADAAYTDDPDHPEYAQWGAGGESFVGTPHASDGVWLTTSGLPQPGTIDLVGDSFCRRFTGAGGEELILPGCRGINAVLNRDTARIDGEVVFRFDDDFDADVDGCVLGPAIDGVPVRGVYADGSPVDLAKCNESTHKTGGYYVWPCGSTNPASCENDENHTKPFPELVDWDGREQNSLSPLSRPGSATLWHPFAGCFADPAQAVSGATCLSVPGEDIEEIQATQPALAARLAWDGRGVKLPSDPTPRNFERDFFLPSGPIAIGGEVVDGFNIRSQIFRSTMAAVSWNLSQVLVATSCDSYLDDIQTDAECFDPQQPFAVGKCSYATPQFCRNVRWLVGLALPPSDPRSSVPDTCIPLMISSQGENTLAFAGTAAAGTTVAVEVDGVSVEVAAQAGQTAGEVAQAVADAINGEPALQASNTTASVTGSTVTVEGTLGETAIDETGAIAAAEIPSMQTRGLALVALLLFAAAALGIRELKPSR